MNNKSITAVIGTLVICSIIMLFGAFQDSSIVEAREQHFAEPTRPAEALIFETDSLDYEMAAQLCDAKSWNGSVCPALLTLTQELDNGRFARYPSLEDAASLEVNRMVMRVIAIDSLETQEHLAEILNMEK